MPHPLNPDNLSPKPESDKKKGPLILERKMLPLIYFPPETLEMDGRTNLAQKTLLKEKKNRQNLSNLFDSDVPIM